MLRSGWQRLKISVDVLFFHESAMSKSELKMEKLYVNPEIEIASTIPTEFYTSPEYYDLSREKIFAATWQYCLSAEELALSEQLVPHTLLPGMLDEPILFLRDNNAEIKCFSNVCTHRGNILVDSPCVAQHIRCRYHGRRFNLAGEMVHMPAFECAKNFPSQADNLPNVPFENLSQFLFAAVKPKVSFNDVFGEMQQRLAWLPFENMRLNETLSRDYLVHAHWALYCENYLEGLHIPFVHKSLNAVIDYKNYVTEVYRYSNLQLGIGKQGDDVFDLPASSVDYGKHVAAYYYWVFPNMMFNFYPWGCSVNIVKPINLQMTKVSFLTFVLDETKLHLGAGSDLDRVEREDEAIVEAVQKGVRSRFYNSGRYSPTMEKGTHHFHRLICEFMNG